MFQGLQLLLNPDAGAAAAVNNDRKYKKNVVYIKQSVLNEMVAHCRDELPYEACGLLSGKQERNETLWKIRNLEKSPTSFAMDMKQVGSTVKIMRNKMDSMTGIYHSHPTAAPFPSSDDVRNAHYPDAAYFIVSFAFGSTKVKCYRIKDLSVTQLNIEVIK